jgi:hypothetical protein
VWPWALSFLAVSGVTATTGLARTSRVSSGTPISSADEIRARTAVHRSPVVMQAIDDYLAGRRYPLDLIYTHSSCVYTYV